MLEPSPRARSSPAPSCARSSPVPAPRQCPPVPASRQCPPVPAPPQCRLLPSTLQCRLLASALQCLLLASALQCLLLASAPPVPAPRKCSCPCWFPPALQSAPWHLPPQSTMSCCFSSAFRECDSRRTNAFH